MEGVIRKIVIGRDPKDAMAYYVGMRAGSGEVSAILFDEEHMVRYNKSRYPFTIGDNTVSIVCEDCASACAVTDWYRGVALMGTHLTNEALRIISKSVKVIVALDKDATRKAIDVVMRIKSKVPTRLVTLDRDLKVLTKNEIWEILE